MSEEDSFDEELDVPTLWFKNNNRIDYKGIGDSIIWNSEHVDNTKLISMIDNKDIYMFEEGHYVNKGKAYVERNAQNTFGVHSSISNKAQIVDFVVTETAVDRSKFNKPGPEINMANGIYNVDTGEHRIATVDDLYTYKYAVAYDKEAECPEIMRFLDKVLPNDKELIIEEIAYCFMPGQPFEKIFAWVGEGRLPLINLIKELLGVDNISYASLQQLGCGSQMAAYQQADLYGKSLNVCENLSNKSIKYFDFLKHATSIDSTILRHAHGKSIFSFVNNAKFLISMNEWPEIKNLNEDFFRNIQYTEFNDLCTEPLIITDRELSGFFNVVMESLKSLRARGCFCKNVDVGDVRKTLSPTDSVDLFLSAKTELKKNTYYIKSELYDDYIEWLGDSVEPVQKTPFYKYVNKSLKLSSGERRNENGTRKRAYKGIIKK